MSTRLAVAIALSFLTACVGPALLGTGRGTHNAVINRTEDEQILSMAHEH